MKKSIILFLTIIMTGITATEVCAQVTPVNKPNLSGHTAEWFSDDNFVGTFQYIHHTKKREVFTKEIYYEIEAKRHATEVVLWEVSALTTIRIFPTNLIMPPSNYRVNTNEIIEITGK